MRILIDTNIIPDIVQKRKLFRLSASAVTDIFYVLRKTFQSAQKVKTRIERHSQIVTFADGTGCRYSYHTHALHAGL